MQPKVSILFLCSEFPPGPGGIGNHGFNLSKSFISKGYKLSVLTNLENSTKKDAFNFAKKNNLKVYYIERKRIVPIQIRRLMFGLKLFNSHDIVLCSGMFSIWMGAILNIFYRKKLIAIAHGSEITDNHNIRKKITKWALKKFNSVISVSNYTQDQITPKYSNINYTVIPNGIISDFLKNYFVNKPEKWQGNPSLLTVGNVTRRKGQHNLIKALPQIIKHFPEVHYHIVGLPTLENEFKNLAESLDVLKYITFHGKVPENILYESYQSCDIFVMLSEKQPDGDVEGFGIAILEANYYGMPAIGATGCGIEDAIQQNLNGVKVNSSNSNEIVSAISQILNNKNEYKNESMKWAHIHDWNDIIMQYIKVING